MRRLFLIMFLPCCIAACATTHPPAVDKSKMAEGYFMKGLSYFQANNYELAFVEFQRAIQTDDKNKQAYYYLGIVSDRQGKFAEAEKYFKEALDIDSDYSEAYNMLGVISSRQQKWKEAKKYYYKALENKLYTTPHIPHLNLGHMYMEQRDYERAVDAYREAKRYVNQDFISYFLGNALLEAGKVKEAINELQEGVALSPANANIRYSLAVALLKGGDKGAAVTEFKKAAELAPGSELAQKANEYLKTLR